MKTFKIAITETLQLEVEVRANSVAEAEEICERRWKDGDYVLSADHFKGVAFAAQPIQKNRGHER